MSITAGMFAIAVIAAIVAIIARKDSRISAAAAQKSASEAVEANNISRQQLELQQTLHNKQHTAAISCDFSSKLVRPPNLKSLAAQQAKIRSEGPAKKSSYLPQISIVIHNTGCPIHITYAKLVLSRIENGYTTLSDRDKSNFTQQFIETGETTKIDFGVSKDDIDHLPIADGSIELHLDIKDNYLEPYRFDAVNAQHLKNLRQN